MASHTTKAKEQWDDYISPITDTISSIKTTRDAIKITATVAVSIYLQSKILGTLGTMYGKIKDKAINYLNSNPKSTPKQYLQTNEGILFEAAGENRHTTHQMCTLRDLASGNNIIIPDFVHNSEKCLTLIPELKLDKNKINHILPKKHAWDLVVKNPNNQGEVLSVIEKVLRFGKVEPYEGAIKNNRFVHVPVFRKSLVIEKQIVEIYITEIEQNTFAISNAWVRTRCKE